MSPEKSAPGAPESEEDVVQIQSALCEDILTLFPNGHQGAGVVVKTPARRRSLSLSLSLSLFDRASVCLFESAFEVWRGRVLERERKRRLKRI